MAFYAGKGGAVTVNTVAQPLTDWSMDVKTDSLDVTNFTSGGWQELYSGIFSADISCSGPYDGSSSVTQGTIATFILQVATGLTVTLTALVTSVKVDQNVKDVAKVSYTATTSGVHTITV